MDVVGWYIVTTHQLLGHDKTARVLGVDPRDKATCVICKFEANPTTANRLVVELALAPEGEGSDS
jgi:hypothetical protein